MSEPRAIGFHSRLAGSRWAAPLVLLGGEPALGRLASEDRNGLNVLASLARVGSQPSGTPSADQLIAVVSQPWIWGLATVGLVALVVGGGWWVLRHWDRRGDPLTRRRGAECRALAEREERFRLALQATEAGVWDWDLRTERVYYSPRWKQILGYADDEIGPEASEWETRLHPEDRVRARETLQAFLAGETGSYQLVHRLQHKDGTYRWILARGLVLRDPEGHAYRLVGSHIDVTDHKRAEEQLQETAEALRRSNRDLEQFASIASHDLQEPLRMLSAYLDTLARQYREYLPSQAHLLLDLALQTAKQMQQLTQGLLVYSRVSTGEVELLPVDCNEVLAEVLGVFKLTLEEHAARVTSSRLPIVRGDRTQLVQLFQNLIGNGVKFHGDTPPRVQVSAERKGERWQFAIRDNGIGIEPQYAETVFEIFQRLHTSDSYPGTGIGLAICQRIVTRHQGRIWFESVVGQGTTFYFTLPALEADTPTA